MKFRSTRKQSPICDLSEAVSQGLAPDGGLFVPDRWPQAVSEVDLAELKCLAFAEFAERVLKPFFQADKLESALGAMCQTAFDFPIPLRNLDQTTDVLELFWGPTGAFKDFGARFLALCTRHLLGATGEKRGLVLVATSGDTGGAVAAAFSQFTKTPVAILYPKDRISARQEKQLTIWGDRVRAFRVRGTFDDCQRLVKQAFLSQWWQEHFYLLSANSVNIGRLLPQIAYFAFASSLYRSRHGVEPGLIVPSGNLGNAVAALYARRLGFPVGRVIFAHNANRTLPNFFKSGKWRPEPTETTLANAMDVGNPSNFERVMDLLPLQELRASASALSVSDDEIRTTIRQSYVSDKNNLWCPHTATAIHARSLEHSNEKNRHWIVVATAHPSKFEAVIEPIIGETIAIPPSLAEMLAKPSVATEIDPDLDSLRSEIARAHV